MHSWSTLINDGKPEVLEVLYYTFNLDSITSTSLLLKPNKKVRDINPLNWVYCYITQLFRL